MRDAKITRIYDGTNEIQRPITASTLQRCRHALQRQEKGFGTSPRLQSLPPIPDYRLME